MTSPLEEPVNARLADLLSTVRVPGDFYCAGSVELGLPRIDVQGVGRIALPLLPAQAAQLVALAEQAPFGRGSKTLVDTGVRKLGRTPASAKPWKGLGSGVYELVEDHRDDTFRAVYVVRVNDAVHVLHAFQKKSKSGIATPQADVALLEKRLKAVLARYGLSRRS